MKKKIALILILCFMVTMLCSCSTSYKNAVTQTKKDFGSYFSVLKEWNDYMGKCRIVYANDTYVIYFYFDAIYTSGFTPLYNADGTLQIYEGE